MPIQPIVPVSGLSSLESATGTQPQRAAVLDSFSQILGEAISNLNQKDAAANDAIARLAAGEDVELHQVMMAVQEADISMQLALQVRNKIVDAYQEIMRMQV
jgi:flagellar hook-basal body complex protein FliE